MNYAVIMAGGTGKRLWPLSRQKRPKQVLKLLDGQTLLGRCFERLCPGFRRAQYPRPDERRVCRSGPRESARSADRTT